MADSAVQHRPRRWGLKGKLLLAMSLVGVVPLLVGLVLPFLEGMREIQEVSGASFMGLATETARKLDLVVREEIARTHRVATDLRLISALEEQRDALFELTPAMAQARTSEAEREWTAKTPALLARVTGGPLAEILRRSSSGELDDPGHPVSGVTRSATRALFVTDIEGKLLASVSDRVGYSHAHTVWWQSAYKHGIGQPHLGDLYFDQTLNVYAIALSLPVMDRIRYEVVGVLHRVYDAKEFLDPSIFPVKFGKTGHAMVIDSSGIVLSCPILPTGASLADSALIPLVTPVQPGWVKAPSDGHGGVMTSIIGFASLPETSRIAYASTGHRWHTFVWQSSQELFAPIRHFFIWVAAFGSLAVVLLLTLGYVAAGRIVTPSRKLQQAATLIGRGELTSPIVLRTGDEIEDLAEDLSRMNLQLQAAFAGLVDQIELKTKEAEYVQETTQQILDSVPNPVMLLTSDEQVEYMNKAARQVFGIDEERQPTVKLADLLHADTASLAGLRAEFQASASVHSKTKDVLRATSHSSEVVRDPLSPLLAHEIVEEYRDIRIGDRRYRYEWFHVSSRSGDRFRIGLVLRDTTDESMLQDRLIQAEKSGSLSILTAGIGHELNNPLCGILGLGEAIQEESDLQQVKARVQEILQYSRRMAAIVQDFTGLAQIEARGRAVSVDVRDQLEEALKLALQGDDSLRPEVRRQFDSLAPVKAAPEDLRQAFLQVIKNALQAMHGEGVLELSTQVQDGYLSVMIKDTGSGIPKPYLSKIFDPFFTTKEQGEGSGLGLTIVRRIITKYGGTVQVESEEGYGTTCVMTFPIQHRKSGGEQET
jgi:two-component system NtrC family sensor kinase